MPLAINTNVSSLISQRFLAANTSALQNTEEQLSSGLKINSAKDDASGLEISQNLTAQINGGHSGHPKHPRW